MGWEWWIWWDFVSIKLNFFPIYWFSRWMRLGTLCEWHNDENSMEKSKNRALSYILCVKDFCSAERWKNFLISGRYLMALWQKFSLLDDEFRLFFQTLRRTRATHTGHATHKGHHGKRLHWVRKFGLSVGPGLCHVGNGRGVLGMFNRILMTRISNEQRYWLRSLWWSCIGIWPSLWLASSSPSWRWLPTFIPASWS